MLLSNGACTVDRLEATGEEVAPEQAGELELQEYADWIDAFLGKRGLSRPNGEMLFAYRATKAEYSSLQALLARTLECLGGAPWPLRSRWRIKIKVRCRACPLKVAVIGCVGQPRGLAPECPVGKPLRLNAQCPPWLVQLQKIRRRRPKYPGKLRRAVVSPSPSQVVPSAAMW